MPKADKLIVSPYQKLRWEYGNIKDSEIWKLLKSELVDYPRGSDDECRALVLADMVTLTKRPRT